MKVLWIFRQSRKSQFSVETLFDGLDKIMRQKVDLQIYRYDENKTLFSNIRFIRSFKPDIYHITGGGENYLVNFLPNKKTVITVHDIDHYLLTLKGLKKVLYGIFWWKIPLKFTRAKITCISDLTKLKLIQSFNISSERISVIPNCVHPRFQKINSITKINNRILQVGTGKNKNLARVIKAIEGLDCELTIVGFLSEENIRLLEKCKVRYRNLINIDPKSIVEEYNSAAVVTFASISEGFGLPILEAQATETPIITSNIEPMKSIIGHELSLVNPHSIDSIREMIIKILGDSKFSEKIIKLGLLNIEQYSSAKICENYYSEYLSVLDESV